MFNNDYENENNSEFNREDNREYNADEVKEEKIQDFIEGDDAQEEGINSYSWNDDLKEQSIIPANGSEVNDNPAYSMVNDDVRYSGTDKKRKSNFFVRGIAILCGLALCFGAGYAGDYFSNNNINNVSSGNPSNTSSVPDSTAEAEETNKVLQVTSTDNSADDEYTVAEIAEMTANSVVEITTETVQTGNFLQQYVSQGAGSGVIITTDGYIITNNHVIDGASNIIVKLSNSDKEYEAKLIGTDSKTDIAVIKIEETDLQPAIFGDSGKLKVGQDVVAIGNPLGSLGGTVTNGIISALDRDITVEGETMKLLQTNAAINPGNSGGGLFNGSGELVGVVNAKSSGSDIEGLGFAIPSNTAKEIAEDLMNYGYVKGRISLGMTLVDITNTQTAMMYRVQRLGVYILQIETKGSAKDAGLQSGDCIFSVNGTEIDSYSEFTQIIDSHSVGDKLDIVVYRNNQKVTCNITLQEYTQ